MHTFAYMHKLAFVSAWSEYKVVMMMLLEVQRRVGFAGNRAAAQVTVSSQSVAARRT